MDVRLDENLTRVGRHIWRQLGRCRVILCDGVDSAWLRRPLRCRQGEATCRRELLQWLWTTVGETWSRRSVTWGHCTRALWQRRLRRKSRRTGKRQRWRCRHGRRCRDCRRCRHSGHCRPHVERLGVDWHRCERAGVRVIEHACHGTTRWRRHGNRFRICRTCASRLVTWHVLFSRTDATTLTQHVRWMRPYDQLVAEPVAVGSVGRLGLQDHWLGQIERELSERLRKRPRTGLARLRLCLTLGTFDDIISWRNDGANGWIIAGNLDGRNARTRSRHVFSEVKSEAGQATAEACPDGWTGRRLGRRGLWPWRHGCVDPRSVVDVEVTAQSRTNTPTVTELIPRHLASRLRHEVYTNTTSLPFSTSVYQSCQQLHKAGLGPPKHDIRGHTGAVFLQPKCPSCHPKTRNFNGIFHNEPDIFPMNLGVSYLFLPTLVSTKNERLMTMGQVYFTLDALPANQPTKVQSGTIIHWPHPSSIHQSSWRKRLHSQFFHPSNLSANQQLLSTEKNSRRPPY